MIEHADGQNPYFSKKEELTGSEIVNEILYQSVILGAINRVPDNFQGPKSWQKGINILYRYFTTRYTYKVLGNEFKLSEMAISNKVNKTFLGLITTLEEITGKQIPTEKIGILGRKGFQSLSQEKRKENSAKGGRAAHLKGTAHEFTSNEAREAGRIGGEIVSRNREHMADLGRLGGPKSHSGGRPTRK